MSAAKVLTYFGIVLGAAALGAGFGIADSGLWLVPAAMLALLWLVGEWRGWGWLTTVAFVVLVGLAAAGVMLGRTAAWMGTAVVAGVSAWVLGDFTRRVSLLAREADHPLLVRRFLLRLLVLAGTSLALGAVALTLTVRLSFLLVLLLGILLIYGLSRAIGALRSAGQ